VHLEGRGEEWREEERSISGEKKKQGKGHGRHETHQVREELVRSGGKEFFPVDRRKREGQRVRETQSDEESEYKVMAD
jgi:hypothetical protein